jgi:hypothetical protein
VSTGIPIPTRVTRCITRDLTNASLAQTEPSSSLSAATVQTESLLTVSRPPSLLTPLPSPLIPTDPASPTTSSPLTDTPPTPNTPQSQSSLGSPPPLVSISDSEASEDNDYYTMTTQTTTLLKRNSSATCICEQGKPPVITPGRLTPDLLFDFENGAYSYFSFKDIKAEREVSKVAGGLQDGRIQTWYRLNRVAVDAAGFPAFMAHVRESWLEPGWEQNVKLIILASHQGTTPISDWIMLLESTNALLNGHTCKLSDADLRNHIQSHIHPDTMTAATTAELHLIASYDKYKRSLKVVDNARIRADDLLRSAVKQMMSQPTSVRRAVITRFNSAASSSSSSTAINPSAACTPDRLPTLNAAECALLMEHKGCFKCHRFYMSHKSADCPDGFPDKSSYATLTEADALNAKKRLQKKGGRCEIDKLFYNSKSQASWSRNNGQASPAVRR